jgi:hypothetical protein
MMLSLIAAAALGAAQPQATPQPQPQPQPQPTAQQQRFRVGTQGNVPANPADVASIDAIMAAVYDVISGPAGQRRNWDRMRSLFTADARLMPLGPRGLRIGGVEDYIAASGPQLEERGFIEREIGRVTEEYGGIAHVFSAYEARASADGPVIMRGINSFQLVRHDNRWWVVSIMWQPETPQNPIPARYLNRSGR